MIGPFNNPGDDASLEERIHDCRRALTLIRAACNVPDTACIDQDDLIESISTLAYSAAKLIEPLKHAPASVGNWTPPVDDEEGGGR